MYRIEFNCQRLADPARPSHSTLSSESAAFAGTSAVANSMVGPSRTESSRTLEANEGECEESEAWMDGGMSGRLSIEGQVEHRRLSGTVSDKPVIRKLLCLGRRRLGRYVPLSTVLGNCTRSFLRKANARTSGWAFGRPIKIRSHATRQLTF